MTNREKLESLEMDNQIKFDLIMDHTDMMEEIRSISDMDEDFLYSIYDEGFYSFIAVETLVDGCNGIFTPQYFAEWYQYYFDFNEEFKADCSNPDNEFYWSSFDQFLGNYQIENTQYIEYLIKNETDGDLQLIREYK